ncbi:ADP-ribosylglycohydrolase family protein [Vreelandella neptunia]|uniref:ADP-ribosylglycohydrolase family protein n=1 Tax=Vreelandella neptunia TaxID=115551 RepID=A0ABZ0YJM7_9GAMM|nr:ADP-ribosylglycohydrolase family protein [Halomonas neptunia]MDN3562182.1 ADP-ribosylglycohydrolase family protein [Halomonas neptunia]WQH12300.1 ADP-ribosylglycohydrolase family protein [Halomonas neptunia]
MTDNVSSRAIAALRNLFIGDSLAMPVHWFYNVHDIDRAFPDGITTFETPPEFHPSSIMSLHSTSGGGRKRADSQAPREIVGDVILKGKQSYWNRPNVHYHQGMQPGDNTLNAYCALTLMQTMDAPDKHYDRDTFLQAYIRLMTAEIPAHPDTYAESYHRGFFANLEKGLPPHKCGAVTHDTPSIGGLVTIAPLAIGERLRGLSLADTRKLCRSHLALTHPDNFLADVCDAYVELIDALLFRDDDTNVQELLLKATRGLSRRELTKLVESNRPEREVIGRELSTACYITDAWPAVLYLACKHHQEPLRALQINAEVGGDSVHRGAVLGVLLGLINGEEAGNLFARLTEQTSINRAIEGLVLMKS